MRLYFVPVHQCIFYQLGAIIYQLGAMAEDIKRAEEAVRDWECQ